MEELKIIEDFYGDEIAKRSGVKYISHIHEGLQVLDQINAREVSKRAYCVHPIFQVPAYLRRTIKEDIYRKLDPEVILLAMEYRNKANAYVCRERTDHFEMKDMPHMVLPEVRDMLIADKVQNYKDFLKYHKGTHKRSNQLDRYFNMWFKHLNINYNDFKIQD